MSTASTVASPRPSHAMDLLSRGVPLSLLLDLALGPHSEELLQQERVPAQRQATG